MTSPRSSYDAIVFDLFGTLLSVDPSTLPMQEIDGKQVRTTLPTILARCGPLLPGIDIATLGRVLMETTRTIRDEIGDGREIASVERFRRAFRILGVANRDLETAAVLASRVHMDGLVGATSVPEANRAVLQEARRRTRVGIVSNFDDTAAAYRILHQTGLLDLVETIVVSHAVGWRKPHPLPLAVALDELGVQPADALYVGDSYRADVGVASAVGTDVAWIDLDGAGPAGDRVPEIVIAALPELPSALGWS